MAFTTKVKVSLNKWLRHFNLQLETLTAYKQEQRRLEMLERAGHFRNPIFPIPTSFKFVHCHKIFEKVKEYEDRFHDFSNALNNDVGYSFNNGYFSSPDAEVLYALIRSYQPGRIIEIGSGNSTRIARQAIHDGELSTKLVSIDPRPRTEVSDLVDEMYSCRVESLQTSVFERMGKGDILFIDSSHEVKTGNDGSFIYLQIMPLLPPGVLIHIHDIFLPYDYPQKWIVESRWGWNEQYLVQAFLTFGQAFDVLWPGYYLQRTRTDFEEHFPHMRGRNAQSLWLQKV